MTAHAITVLPVPGGATSTPRSCPARAWTAACCGPVSTAEQVNACVVPAALIGQVQLAACLRGEFGHGGEHAARHDQPAVDGLVEELQEPGDVPGGGAHPLLLVELRVVHRGSVPQRRGERGRQVGQLDPDARAEPGPYYGRRLRTDLRGDWRGKPGDLAARRDPPGLVRGPAHLLRRHAAKR